MSYDLLFLPKAPEQSWGDVIAAHEAGIGDAKALEAIGEPMRARFDALLRAIEVEPRFGQRGADLHCVDLHVPESGMQLHLFAAEVSLGVRLTSDRAEARGAAEIMVELGRLIERETGLAGYDPQLHRGLSELREPVAAVAEQIVELGRHVERQYEDRRWSISWQGWVPRNNGT